MINYQRIFIIVFSFFLAFFTGQTILRNLWRLYKTPIRKMITLKDARWKIVNASPKIDFNFISFEKGNKGYLDTIPFYWNDRLHTNQLTISRLPLKYGFLNGVYQIDFRDNEKKIILKNNQYSLKGELKSNRFQGFICKIKYEDWGVNQKIPWF